MKTISQMTYDEYMALLDTCDEYARCKRCGKLTDSIYPYCVACATATGKGDRPTWGGKTRADFDAVHQTDFGHERPMTESGTVVKPA